MAKVQINADFTVGANGLQVESGLGTVLIGTAKVNLSAIEASFVIPAGVEIKKFDTRSFVIFGDDAPVDPSGTLSELDVNGPADINLGGSATTSFEVVGRTDSNGTDIPAILIRGSVLTAVGAQAGDSVIYLNHLSVHATDGDAGTAGLIQGQLYQTAGGEVRIKL